ncbi:MAG: hypothetical protein JXA71_00875 [Chitinispirillaceae bacterium]|nr:hypothetical protein [Chitinispirillaceae bacterium]
MPNRELAFNTVGKPLPVVAHGNVSIAITKLDVDLLEVADALFYPESAVMLPEQPIDDGVKVPPAGPSITGLGALAIALKQFEFNPAKRLLIAGHTDTVGKPKDNFLLSQECAQNVLFLLTGKKTEWVNSSFARHTVKDCQAILKYIAAREKWSCNPGKIDGVIGIKTKGALKAFLEKTIPDTPPTTKRVLREKIVTDFAASKKMAKETWTVIYDLYDKALCSLLEVTTDRLTAIRSSLVKFVNDAKPFVGCGHSFPIKDKDKKNYRSKENRRVELLFFNETAKPVIVCPVAGDAVHTDKECPLWNKYCLKPTYIPPDDLHSVVFHLDFKYYDRIKKQVLSIPAALPIKAFENKTDDPTKATAIDTSVSLVNGIQFVKVNFKKPITDPARKSFHFEFATTDQWVFTDSLDKNCTPKMATKTAAEIKALAPLDRFKYYDLPAKWSSMNYFTRYDYATDAKKGGRFEEVMKVTQKLRPWGEATTSPGSPLVFSLDDIVLVDGTGSQIIRDKDENDAAIDLIADAANSKFSRFSLFHVVGGDLVLYNALNANAPFFTDSEFAANLIADVPPDARVVAFANDFYSVFDKRTAQGAEAFDVTKKQIRGCRAAKFDDADWHYKGICNSANNPAGHFRYFAKDTGNYELHYFQNGCPFRGSYGLQWRAFLLIYWTARFIKDTTTPATDAQVTTYATNGMLNAKERWESKGYTIEPLDTAFVVQIKPVFFFESKDLHTGGSHKCRVKVSNNPDDGAMGNTSSTMYWKDYQDNDYQGIGEYTDIDNKKYTARVVAHELGHAEGKDDDYAYWSGNISAGARNADDERFSQYYLGMPYSDDAGSMMKDNRAPRMRHVWPFVNWVNDASRTANQLKAFLKEKQYRTVLRYGTKTLSYYLSHTPNDYRDIYSPFRFARRVNTGTVVDSSGTARATTGTVDLALYKIGEDEMARGIKINNVVKPFAFDGILSVFLKIGVTFLTPLGGSAPTNRQKKAWILEMKTLILSLQNRFFLQDSTGKNDFKNTFIYFLPLVLEGAPADKCHYTIEVSWNDSSDISKKQGKELKLGNDTAKSWILRYIFGKNDGAVKAFFKRVAGTDKVGTNELTFIRTWIRAQTGCNNFELRDA